MPKKKVAKTESIKTPSKEPRIAKKITPFKIEDATPVPSSKNAIHETSN